MRCRSSVSLTLSTPVAITHSSMSATRPPPMVLKPIFGTHVGTFSASSSFAAWRIALGMASKCGVILVRYAHCFGDPIVSKIAGTLPASKPE